MNRLTRARRPRCDDSSAFAVRPCEQSEALLRSERDLALKLGRTTDLSTALKELLQMVLTIAPVDCGAVFFLDSQTGDLQIEAHAGQVSQAFLKRFRRFPANSSRAQIVRKGQPAYDRADLTFTTPDVGDEKLRAVAILPLAHENVVLGSVHLGSHTHEVIPPDSRIALETFTAQAAGAIARIRAETERRRLERQILDISDREQARIGQELHDGLCQQLVSLAFDANSLQSELARAQRPELPAAARIAKYLDQAITEARGLARGLFPVRLEADGLASALADLAQALSARFGIDCSAQCKARTRPADAAAAVHLYRIAQEAALNAIKHGRAKNVRIRLEVQNAELRLEVEDDGRGLERAEGRTGGGSNGMGLHIMDYRARSLGGYLRVARGAQGGTRVCCCVPLDPPQTLPA